MHVPGALNSLLVGMKSTKMCKQSSKPDIHHSQDLDCQNWFVKLLNFMKKPLGSQIYYGLAKGGFDLLPSPSQTGFLSHFLTLNPKQERHASPSSSSPSSLSSLWLKLLINLSFSAEGQAMFVRQTGEWVKRRRRRKRKQYIIQFFAMSSVA